MASFLADHQEIRVVQTISGQTPKTLSFLEKAAGTFLAGVPVMTSGGVLLEWNATVGAASSTVGIAGITRQAGSNLASDGLGFPLAFQPVGAPGTGTTYGKVPYQTSGVNIPFGAPMSDGRNLVELAVGDTIFEAQWDDAGGTASGPAITDIGKQYGLTKDATGHWYVDKAKVTQGTNTVLYIVQVNPGDVTTGGAGINNARVWFKFIASIMQYSN